MRLPKVLLATTGGTIAMTARADGAGVAPALDVADLLASVPGLDQVADIAPLSVVRKPSASLDLDDLVALAALVRTRLTADVDGAVIVQGTDTIEETAFVLSLLLPVGKPVVVTGAMRSPGQAGADGPANLLAAVTVAATLSVTSWACELGPVVVLNDEIHAALFVQKGHTALTSAFVSPGFGPLGLVAEGRARIALRPAAPPPTLAGVLGRSSDAALDLAGRATPAVALLRIGLGDDGRLLAAAADIGFAGVVIEGAGAGHVPAALAEVVSEAAARLPVVLASRVSAGPAFRQTYGYPGSEIDLLQRGAIGAGVLSGLKARLLLQLLLRAGADAGQIRAAFGAFAG